MAIEFIKPYDLNNELHNIAIKSSNGMALQYIEDQNYNLCLNAVKFNSSVI